MSHHPVRNWHIVISGFLQREGYVVGMVKLYNDLRYLYAGPETDVHFSRWHGDFDALAELIFRLAPDDATPVVKVYAYSWGAGHGFIKLARALADRDLPVEVAVLSDPVYCSRLCIFRWLAMLTASCLRVAIPANVREVRWFRQTMNRPRAHGLVAESAETKIFPPIYLSASHQYMDDHPMFRSECLSVARRKEVAA